MDSGRGKITLRACKLHKHPERSALKTFVPLFLAVTRGKRNKRQVHRHKQKPCMRRRCQSPDSHWCDCCSQYRFPSCALVSHLLFKAASGFKARPHQQLPRCLALPSTTAASRREQAWQGTGSVLKQTEAGNTQHTGTPTPCALKGFFTKKPTSLCLVAIDLNVSGTQ